MSLKVGLWKPHSCFLDSEFITGERERDYKRKRSCLTSMMRKKIITERILFRNYNSWNIYMPSTVIRFMEEE